MVLVGWVVGEDTLERQRGALAIASQGTNSAQCGTLSLIFVTKEPRLIISSLGSHGPRFCSLWVPQGQKNLLMKVKLVYEAGGKKMQEMTSVNSFPVGY